MLPIPCANQKQLLHGQVNESIAAAFPVLIVGAIAAEVTAGTGITSARRSGLALSIF
jgi:hypothetical protein